MQCWRSSHSTIWCFYTWCHIKWADTEVIMGKGYFISDNSNASLLMTEPCGRERRKAVTHEMSHSARNRWKARGKKLIFIICSDVSWFICEQIRQQQTVHWLMLSHTLTGVRKCARMRWSAVDRQRPVSYKKAQEHVCINLQCELCVLFLYKAVRSPLHSFSSILQ